MNELTPVIPLAYAEPDVANAPCWQAILRVCHPLAIGCCAAAVLLIAVFGAEVVLVAGPVIGTIGVLMLVGAAIVRSQATLGFGAAHVGICVLFVLLVNVCNWSPGAAYGPFIAMGTVYTLAAATTAAAAAMHRRDGRRGV